MSTLSRKIRRASIVLLASAASLTLCVGAAHAESPAVEALIKQAEYWHGKGRDDLAEDALRRARKIAPNSPAVRQASNNLKAPTPAPAPPPTPARAAASRPQPASTASRPAPAPTSQAPVDRGGNARVAGFDALDRGDLTSAASQFQKAIGVNRRDGDALGGLGLVRLRQNRFSEAADLLEQASRYGKASQWAEGLASARYFAGLEDARSLLAQGRLDDAQAEVEKLVRSGYSQPAPALELLADIYEKQGRYADSADLYRQASEGGATDENRLKARAARGRALDAAQRGDDLTAEREFQNGLLLDRDDPWIRYEFARFMIKRGRLSEAESLLRSLATSGQADSIYAAALLNRDLGRTSAAEQLLDQIPDTQRTQPMRNLAVELKTDSAITRARALAASGRPGDAVSALRQLGGMAAIPVGKQAAIADALLDLGDAASAESVAESALNRPVTNVEDYEGLISVLARTGQDDLARMALQRAGQLAGNSPEGQAAYARMGATLSVSQADRARLAGRFAEAFDLLQGAWNAAPDNVEVLRALGRLYQSGNMPARAAQTYQLVLGRDARDKDALLGLASAAQAAGDRELSEKAQQDALRAYPEDYRVRLQLAQVEQARGDDRAAVRLLKEARDLYTRQQGGSMAGGNPFAGMDPASGSNPFRNQAYAPAPTVNPFALGNGTRLAPVGYQAAPSYQAAPYGQAPYSVPANSGGYGSYQAAAPAAPMQSGWQAQAPQSAAPAFAGGYGGGYGGAPQQAAQAPQMAYSGDPVMNQIQSDIASLSQDTGPRVEFQTSYRNRSGEVGLSAMDELGGSAKFSTNVLDGRIYAKGDAVVIDAGRPTGSGLARFGRNATPEAQAIVDEVASVLTQAETQHESGVALAVGYESDAVKLEVGTTPIGMGKTQATFHAEASPHLSQTTLVRAWAERKPVTDSVVSYAGTRDPVTGEEWGQVMRTGGGVGFSYDRDGTGFYADGRYNHFSGKNVRDNSGFEANLGGYLRAYQGEHSSVTAGINLNYQAYANSENNFTFGSGGYFSPQNFLSLSFPVRYALETDKLDVHVAVAPGFQSYSQEQTDLYPTDAIAQAELDALKAQNSDVRSYYDSLSKTGFAVSADASAYYRVSPTTRIGGQTSYNSFGDYSEFRSMIGVRQSFGSVK